MLTIEFGSVAAVFVIGGYFFGSAFLPDLAIADGSTLGAAGGLMFWLWLGMAADQKQSGNKKPQDEKSS